MLTFHRFRLLGLFAGLIWGACLSSTQAAFSLGTVSVDFNTAPFRNAGPNAVVAPGTWNEVDASNPINTAGVALNLSTGAASGVTMTFSAPGSYNATLSTTQAANSPNVGLLSDYLFTGSTTQAATVTLTGLVTGTQYDLYLYSAADLNGRVTNFSVNEVAMSATFAEADTTFVNGHNYVRYAAISPTAGGSLTISFTAGNGEGDLNGFQLVAVPEPATWLGGVGLAGVAGLMVRRRLVQG